MLSLVASALAATAVPCPWGPYPGNETIVLAPESPGSAPPALLLYVPGGQVPNWHYVNSTREAQRRMSPDVDLYVAIISCPNDLCMPTAGAIDPQMADALKQAAKLVGSPVPAGSTFVAGHSLGATTADLWARNHTTAHAGVMLFGGVIPYGMMASYPAPLMLVAAELDYGAGRITKQAHYYKDALGWANGDDEKMLREKAVVVVPGIDHSDFCRGFAVRGDLPTETQSDAAVRKTVGGVISDWLLLHTTQRNSTAGGEAMESMLRHKAVTDRFMQPFLSLWALEQGGWCEQAQQVVATAPAADGTAVASDQLDIFVRHTLQVDDGSAFGENCTYPNPCGFEQLHVNYSGGVNSSTPHHLHLEIDSFNWLWPNGSNVGAYVSAKAAGCKLVSRQRVREQLGMSAVSDPADVCMEINEQALKLAAATLPNRSIARWEQQGKPMFFAPDFKVELNAGIFWIRADPQYNETAANLTLASPKLYTEINKPPLIFSGVHYCKLLSPAYAADWIMYDSMKEHRYGTGSGNWTE